METQSQGEATQAIPSADAQPGLRSYPHLAGRSRQSDAKLTARPGFVPRPASRWSMTHGGAPTESEPKRHLAPRRGYDRGGASRTSSFAPRQLTALRNGQEKASRYRASPLGQ